MPPTNPRNPSPPQEDLFQPKLDSSFAIDSLLHSLRPPSSSEDLDGSNRGCWGRAERARASPLPRPRYASSARSASASSASPASTSSSSDEEWKGARLTGKRVPLNGEDGSDDYEDYRRPAHKSARREPVAPPWELPTSYAKYAPPNAVAPPSMRFNGSPLMPLHGGLPLYGYGSSPVAPSHFLGHNYWPILPSGRVSVPAPPLLMDLDNMLQSVPPNKSVFDVLVPNSQNSHAHHQPSSQYTLQNGPPLTRYPQYWLAHTSIKHILDVGMAVYDVICCLIRVQISDSFISQKKIQYVQMWMVVLMTVRSRSAIQTHTSTSRCQENIPQALKLLNLHWF